MIGRLSQYTYTLGDGRVIDDIVERSDAAAAATLEQRYPGSSGQVARCEREPVRARQAVEVRRE